MNSCLIRIPNLAFGNWLNKNINNLTLDLIQKFLASKRITDEEDIKSIFTERFQPYLTQGTHKERLRVFLNNAEIQTAEDFYQKLKLDSSSDSQKEVEDESNNKMQVLQIAQDQFNKSTYESEIDNIYKHSRQVNTQRINHFKQDIVQRVIIRIKGNGQRGFITSSEELQQSILDYKQSLFKTITTFLKDIPEYQHLFLQKQSLYTGLNRIFNEQYFFDVMNAMQDYFEKNDVSYKINDEYLSSRVIKDSLSSVVEAYLNLKYFDEIISKEIKILYINPELKNFRTGYKIQGLKNPVIKYKVSSKNENAVKDWSKAEVRDGIKEASGILKQVLESTEIIDRSSQQYTGKTLTVANVIKAWNKLLHNIILDTSKHEERSFILDNIYQFNENPQQALFNILNNIFLASNGTLINSPEILTEIIKSSKKQRKNLINHNLVFNESDANVLYTFFTSFLRNSNKSYFGIEDAQIKNGEISLNSLLFQELFPGMLLRINPTQYLETIYDRDQKKYKTRLRPQYDSNRDLHQYRSILNANFNTMSDKMHAAFVNKYGIQYTNSQYSIQVRLNGNDYIIKTQDTLFVSTNLSSTKIFDLNNNDVTSEFTEFFIGRKKSKDDTTIVFSKERVNQLLEYFKTNRTDSPVIEFVGETLKFINDCLNLDLTSEAGLNTLITAFHISYMSQEDFVKQLLGAAAKIALFHKLQNDYNESNTDKELHDWLSDNDKTLTLNGRVDFKKILIKVRNKEAFDAAGNLGWADLWFNASGQYRGADQKSVLKNMEGNNIPNTRPSSLAGQFRQHLHGLSTQSNSAGSKLLFSSDDASNVIMNISPASDLQSEYGIQKSYVRANVSELAYDNFVNKFLNLLTSTGAIGSQITVYSDKTFILTALVNISQKFFRSGNEINLLESNSDRLIKLYNSTVGEYFKTQINAVKGDLITVLASVGKPVNHSMSLEELNDVLKTMTLNELIEARKKYNLEHKDSRINIANELHYKVNKDGTLSLNQQHLYYSWLFSNIKNLKERFNSELLNYVSGLYEYNFQLSQKSILKDLLDNKGELIEKLTGIKKEQFEKEWINNGKLVLAKDVNGNIITSKNDIKEGIYVNPLLEKFFYLDNIISQNLKYAFMGSETSHEIKANPDIKAALLETGLFSDDVQLNNLSQSIYSLYNGLNDVLYTQEQRDAIKKVFHSINSKYIASAENTAYKRNIIFPATFDARDTSTVRGSQKNVKVALIEEQVAPVYTVNGDSNTIEADDGGARVISFEAIQMNGALGDKAVGYDVIKSIGYNYDSRTGIMSELKFAAHTISNAQMRLAVHGLGQQFNRISLHGLFKKMCNIEWDDNVKALDITENKQHCINQSVNFKSDITSGDGFTNNQLMYEELGNVYEIVNLKKVNDIYYTLERQQTIVDGEIKSSPALHVAQLFNSLGEPIKVRQNQGEQDDEFFTRVEEMNLQSITSLYKLWEAMGGLDSGHYSNDGEFVYDESSHYAVNNFMDNVNIKISDGLLTQENYKQPLKEYYIHYAAPPSTMKTGQFNINKLDDWYNNEQLDYMEFSAQTFGPQQDPDHTADESEMSEFTQVIASLDSGGKTHWIAKTVFHDLGKLAENILKDDFEALENYININLDPNSDEDAKYKAKSKLYEIIGEQFIKNGAIRSESLGLSIINKVRENFNISRDHTLDKNKIPFSDPNVWSQVIGTYITHVNKAIKRKHPGSGDVIMPSYNACCLWEVDGLPYTFEDLFREASKVTNIVRNPQQSILNYKRAVVKDWLTTKQSEVEYSSIDSFQPSDIINVYSIDDKLIKTIDLDNPENYYALIDRNWDKLGLSPDEEYKFKLNVTESRNLKPQRTTFTFNLNGETIQSNLYNLRPVWEKFNGINTTIDLDKVIDDLTNGKPIEVRRNGEFITVQANTNSVQNYDAEAVVSNHYKTKLGQGNRTLNDILKNGIKVESYHKYNFEKTDLIFVNGTGKHTLITFDKLTKDTSRIETIEWNHLETKLDKHGNLHILAKIKNNTVEVGRGVLNNNYSLDADGNVIDENKELVDKSKYIIKDGVVYEKVLFVQKQKQYVYGKEVINKYDKYFIDLDSIRRVFEIQKDPNKPFNEEGYKKFITESILVKLYEGSGLIQINDKLQGKDINKKKQQLFNILKSLTYSKNLTEQEVEFIEKSADCLQYYDHKKGLLDSTSEIKGKQIQPYKQILKMNLEERRATRMANFNMSRYIVAARIPAQSLQSYMKMKIMAYINSPSNLAMVSRWQTFLQGSDYDIDKAYIMGFSFDDNGNFIKWSPLFRYNAMQESCLLPTPNGKNIEVVESVEQADLDLSNEFDILSNIYYASDPTLSKQTMELLARVIHKIDSIQSENVSIYIGKGALIQYTSKIVEDIQNHENYKIPEKIIEEAYKNSISSKIQAIVSDIRNVPLAYSFVTMKDLRNIASQTPEGKSSGIMTSLNPMTKYIMQYQNMVGKEVIGIAAVGEKVFMGLSYYYNELVRETDPEKLRKNLNFLTFNQEFDRIQGRYNKLLEGDSKFYGNFIKVTKTTISDTNLIGLANAETIKNRLYQVDAIRTKLLEEGKDELYINTVLSSNSNKYRKVDLIISQLLSAATDNAKELILKRINADANMAGIYIHLIILGFDINDIVAFMTSPAIETLVKRTTTNMFYEFNNDFIAVKDMSNKINEALGKLNGYAYVDREAQPSHIKWAIKNASESYGFVSDENLSNSKGEQNKKLNFTDYTQAIVLELVRHPEKESEFKQSEYKDAVTFLAGQIRDAVKVIKNNTGLNDDEALKYYINDLKEFKHIHSVAKETTFLGTALLGLNKGLSTDQSDLNSKVNRINKFFHDQMTKYGDIAKLDVSKDDWYKDSKAKSFIEKVLESKPFLRQEGETIEEYAKDIIDTIKRAVDLGINQFSFIDFLNNINNYREVTADFYNLIKDQYNVFDLMNKSPQYNAAVDAFKLAMVVPISTITKNKILSIIQDEIRYSSERVGYLTKQQEKQLQSYADTLLISKWLESPIGESRITFPINKGDKVFTESMQITEASTDTDSEIVSTAQKAQFKKWIEYELIPSLIIDGKYTYHGNTVTIDKNNKLIKLLVSGIENNIPVYKVNLRLNEVDSSITTAKQYQEVLNALQELRKVKIGNYSIADYLMLYSIGTSLNHYGNDRLTGIFREIAKNDPNSLMAKFFDYEAAIDYKLNAFTPEQLKSFLREFGFTVKDALIAIAPIYDSTKKSIDQGKYVKDNTTMEYKKRKQEGTKYSYDPIDLFESYALNSEQQKIAMYNVMTFGMLYLPSKDANSNYFSLLQSDEKEDVKDALIRALKARLIEIRKKC